MRDSDIDSLSADGAQDTERMTPPPEPRTAAGRVMLEWEDIFQDQARDHVLAIEAEAAGTPLREALQQLILEVEGHADVEPTETDGGPMEQARVALDATSSEPRYVYLGEGATAEDVERFKQMWQSQWGEPALSRQSVATERSDPARCQQTNGIGIPRWPNDRCILNEGHDSDHQYIPVPAPLDVEALAQAFHMTQRCVHGVGAGEPMQVPGYLNPDREWARDVAEEYARLTARAAAPEDTP